MNKLQIVSIPALAVRLEPTDSSEMTSQLLLGEKVEILQKDRQWLQIKSTHDGYQGWVDEKGLSEEELLDDSATQLVISPILRGKSEKGEMISLSLGSLLRDFNASNNTFRVDGIAYEIVEGIASSVKKSLSISEVLELMLDLRNAPYLWGGRTLMGIDCSGFTQVIFRLLGIDLPRDASQQVVMGEEVQFIQSAVPGDLAFFDNEEGNITHVGILLDSKTIIHASGKVRVDAFDQQGIFNKKANKYTHKLRIVKRVVI